MCRDRFLPSTKCSHCLEVYNTHLPFFCPQVLPLLLTIFSRLWAAHVLPCSLDDDDDVCVWGGGRGRKMEKAKRKTRDKNTEMDFFF